MEVPKITPNYKHQNGRHHFGQTTMMFVSTLGPPQADFQSICHALVNSSSVRWCKGGIGCPWICEYKIVQVPWWLMIHVNDGQWLQVVSRLSHHQTPIVGESFGVFGVDSHWAFSSHRQFSWFGSNYQLFISVEWQWFLVVKGWDW